MLSLAFQVDTRGKGGAPAASIPTSVPSSSSSSGAGTEPPAWVALLPAVSPYYAAKVCPPGGASLSQHQFTGASFEWNGDGSLMATSAAGRPVRVFNASGDLVEQIIINGYTK